MSDEIEELCREAERLAREATRASGRLDMIFARRALTLLPQLAAKLRESVTAQQMTATYEPCWTWSDGLCCGCESCGEASGPECEPGVRRVPVMVGVVSNDPSDGA